MGSVSGKVQTYVSFCCHDVANGATELHSRVSMTPPCARTTPTLSTFLDCLNLNATLAVLSDCSTTSGDKTAPNGLAALRVRSFRQEPDVDGHPLVRLLGCRDPGLYRSCCKPLAAPPGIRPSEVLRRTLLQIIHAPDGGATQKLPAYWAAFALIVAD